MFIYNVKAKTELPSIIFLSIIIAMFNVKAESPANQNNVAVGESCHYYVQKNYARTELRVRFKL